MAWILKNHNDTDKRGQHLEEDSVMINTGLIPTARAVVDINRPCNARCRMCYYTYENSQWSKPIEKVRQELLAAKQRGNTSVDFTGGEPTIYPHMVETIRFAESIGLHTCIITNGLALEKIKRLIDAGCHEWLVSLHGYEEGHDKILNVQGAWIKVNKAIEILNERGCFVRINCTLTRHNFKDLPRLARHYLDSVKPRVVNFINFNPHYQWGNQEQPEIYQRLNEVQVRVSEVAPYLCEALDFLNEKNVWTNVRYFPFCVIKGYESHICNNPQVMFDPYEWDYGVAPKTMEAYLAHGRKFQEEIGFKDGACARCGMKDVCGGVHKNYARLYGDTELVPYSEQSDYPYYFKNDIEADIVIPAYESGSNLQKLLAEISEKTVPPYNLILIRHRKSAAQNRNLGLHRTNSAYIIMCDDDIEDLPLGWNRQLVYVLKENREILAASARLMNPDGSPGRNTANNYDLASKLADVDMIPTACCIFRKTDVRFDERYIRAGWEDTDFFMQLKEKVGGKFIIVNQVRVVHLNEEKNCGGTQNTYNEQLFNKKWHGESILADKSIPTMFTETSMDPQLKAHMENGDFKTVVSHLEDVISRNFETPENYNNLACALWGLGERKRALHCFYQAATLAPSNSAMARNFALCCFAVGEVRLFENHLRMFSTRFPYLKEIISGFYDRLNENSKREEAVRNSEKPATVKCISTGKVHEKSTIETANSGALVDLDLKMFNQAKHLTKRGAIDVGHICDIDCKFCYHRFEDRKQRSFLSKQEIMGRLKRDKEEYDLSVTDFTGGEPTIHPDIVEIVDYGRSIGNRICLISHGQWRRMNRIDAIIDAGVYEFLLSIHGIRQDHDSMTNPGAFGRIMESIAHLEKRGIPWRANCVVNSINYPHLAEYAHTISGVSHPPHNTNFIVFSPLAGWFERKEIDIQARHSEIAPQLKEAIHIFSAHNIWVNVRYYPMCMLPGLESHVTCFPQICYDPFEWDYRSYTNMDAQTILNVYKIGKQAGIPAETENHIFHNSWSIIQSQRLYRKGPQCVQCRLRLICDGVADQYQKRFGFSELVPQPGELITDPIFFRRKYPMAVGT